jgi:hypothetical protein
VSAAGVPARLVPAEPCSLVSLIRMYHEIFLRRLVTVEELRNGCERSWCPSTAGPCGVWSSHLVNQKVSRDFLSHGNHNLTNTGTGSRH